MTEIELSQQFLAAMRRAGFEPDCTLIADGKLHRFRDWLDKPGTKNGWYVLFPDLPPAGAFGCWKRGIRETWTGSYSSNNQLMVQRLSMIRELLSDNHEKGRRYAMKIWSESALSNGKHGYLQVKNINAHGIRYSRGALLVPVMDIDGQIHGLQRIYRDGSKCFTKGTDKVGHFFMIGTPDRDAVCIAEGYATAATIHEITGHAVAIAFDAGNLLPVAEVLRRNYPDHRIIICADNDKWTEGNPGLTKARVAADAVDGELVVPLFADFASRGTDFNDLCIEEGNASVHQCFNVIGGMYV